MISDCSAPFLLIISLFLLSCGENVVNKEPADESVDILSYQMVPGQLPAPATIKSVQLYRQGNPGNPPVIEAGESQKLILSFDELTNVSGQFRITFTHHDPKWNESNIPVEWYLDGPQEVILGGGIKNQFHQPNYFHYQTEIPGDRSSFIIGGNYMLHVTDFASGTRLFSLPFYVTEEVGEMESRVETIFNIGPRNGPVDQPFSIFKYPDFVQFPQFDLEYYFIQNRFFGRSKQTETSDISVEGETQFYLPRNRSFSAYFDFSGLNLNNLSSEDFNILEFIPDENPPRIILREDVLNFSSDIVPRWRSGFGRPESDRSARYANVVFTFDDGGRLSANSDVYITGDFNQWRISNQSKMKINPNTGYREQTLLIKEGTYTYKYVTKDGNSINDLLLNDSVARSRQEYMSLVYYKDPDYQYYRLLNLDIYYSQTE